MSANPGPVSKLPAEVRAIIEERLKCGHFFVKPPASISLEHVPSEDLAWEIYHGRLLDAAQTRRRQTFESWNLSWIEEKQPSAEPILSVKFETEQNCLHVTRGIECYAWEAYDDGGNVILTREVRKWTRELVATLDLGAYDNLEHLREDLGFRLFQAVIGTSRLPLTSLEAPLPGFSLGKLAYFPHWVEDPTFAPRESPFEIVDQWSSGPPSKREEATTLEFLLRTEKAMAVDELAKRFVLWWEQLGHPSSEIPALVVRVLDEVSLSPYTDFLENLLGFLRGLHEQGTISFGAHADILCSILRRQGRHLTAFDLVKFHHRGANYPDLLMLDAVLKELLALVKRQPELLLPADAKAEVEGRACVGRRLALKQGYFFRRRYEGHPVPDVPTSHGENMRVLPPSFRHVAEEQILEPESRTRRLFDDDPIDAHITPFVRVLLGTELTPEEVQEFGTALFLDRPLGVFKHPTEPDQTLLLSYVAFSRTLAEQRLAKLKELGLLTFERYKKAQEALAALTIDGMPIPRRSIPSRPGVPSLQDAFKVAPDFVLLRTTRRTLNDFIAQFDLEPLKQHLSLDFLGKSKQVVILGGRRDGNSPNSVMICDPSIWLEFQFDPKAGYVVHRGHEYPAGGLQLMRVWELDRFSRTMLGRTMEPQTIRIGPRS